MNQAQATPQGTQKNAHRWRPGPRQISVAMTIVDPTRSVTGGVDTHLDMNVAAGAGRASAACSAWSSSPPRPRGTRRTAGLARQASAPWPGSGVEGTSSYGAGLARLLRRAGVEVVEVDRPNRQARRRTGKSDPVDAIEAARAALSGRALGAGQDQGRQRGGHPGAGGGQALGPVDTKIKAMNQIRHLGFTAPDELRQRLHGLSRYGPGRRRRPPCGPGRTATRWPLPPRPPCAPGPAGAGPRRRERAPRRAAGPLVAKTAPELLGLYGVGIDTAAALLVAAGDNPERLRSEAAWAHLCGVAPIEASSGKVDPLAAQPGR